MLNKHLPIAALAVFGMTSVACAAQNDSTQRARSDRRSDKYVRSDRQTSKNGTCKTNGHSASSRGECCPAPEPAAPCYPDDCIECPRCLGPENFSGNPPVCPMSCGGDFLVYGSALYWRAHQDGMEFCVDTAVTNPSAISSPPLLTNIQQLNQLSEAIYKTPHATSQWGFKLGLGYCSPCDGWDVDVIWTWFRGKSHSHAEADYEDNRTLLPLWSQFAPAQGSILYATDADDHWKVKLNLVDIELGRNYWVSKYLAIRPFVGVRYASINQHTEIAYNGGAYSALVSTTSQPSFNDYVDIHNCYRGAGLRAGLNSEWNLGCGWAIYGNAAFAIIYGKFKVHHNEDILLTVNPHTPTNILNSYESFRAARASLDLALGLQWSTMFCDCQYGFTALLGWEQHVFFHQNQMWRVVRSGAEESTITVTPPVLNLTGSNVYEQRRGTLDTQGVTLTFRFTF